MPKVSAAITKFLKSEQLSDAQKAEILSLIGAFQFDGNDAITCISINSSGLVTGNTLASTTTLTVGTNATIGGTLAVTGNATFIANLAVMGTGNFLGNANITGALSVTSNLTVSGTTTLGTTTVGALTATSVAATSATVGGSTVRPGVWKILTNEVTNSTTANVDLAGFSFTPVSGKTYEVELMLYATSAATTTGVQITATGGSGALFLLEPNTAAAPLGISAIGGTYTAVSAPAAATRFVIMLKGTFAATGTTPLTFGLKSEVGSSAVSLLPNSYARFTPIN